MFRSPEPKASSSWSSLIASASTHPLLTQQARDTLAGLGITSFGLGRASRDLYTNNSSSTTTIGRAVTGFDGSFEFADRLFDQDDNVQAFYTHIVMQTVKDEPVVAVPAAPR